MALTRLSGAKSLRDPLVFQFLVEWVTSSPLAKARWYEATEVAQLRSSASSKERPRSNIRPSSSRRPN